MEVAIEEEWGGFYGLNLLADVACSVASNDQILENHVSGFCFPFDFSMPKGKRTPNKRKRPSVTPKNKNEISASASVSVSSSSKEEELLPEENTRKQKKKQKVEDEEALKGMVDCSSNYKPTCAKWSLQATSEFCLRIVRV